MSSSSLSPVWQAPIGQDFDFPPPKPEPAEEDPPLPPRLPLTPARQPFPPRFPQTSTNAWHQSAKDLWLTAPRNDPPCSWCRLPRVLSAMPFPACVGWGPDVHCANVTFWIGGVGVLGVHAAAPAELLDAWRLQRFVGLYQGHFERTVDYAPQREHDLQKALVMRIVAGLKPGSMVVW